MWDVVSILHLAVGLVVAAPLIYASATKLLDPSRFASAIPRFDLRWLPASEPAARTVGFVEFMAGSAVILWDVSATAVLAAALYFALGLALFRARLRGQSGDCGCFGAIAGGIDERAVLRNALVAAGALSLGFAPAAGLLPPYGWYTALLVVGLLALAAAALDTFLDFERLRGGSL